MNLLQTFDFFLSPVIAVASDFWVTRWLTTLWLSGIGVTLGFVVLGLFLSLFLLLSRIPIVERGQRNGTSLWLTLIISTLLTVGNAIAIQKFSLAGTDLRNDEWLLYSLAHWPIFGVLVGSILYCGQRRFLSEIYESITTGVGGYISSMLAIIAISGLLCSFLVDEPLNVIQNIPTLFKAGDTKSTFEIPGQTGDPNAETEYTPIALKYDYRYVREVIVQSRQNVLLSDAKTVDQATFKPIRIQAREDLVWTRGSKSQAPIAMVAGGNVYAQNLEVDPAEITFTIRSEAPYPESIAIFSVAACVVVLGLLWMLLLAAAPKLSAIAIAAAKNELSQPLPTILMLLGGLFLVAFVHVPYHTEGEDIKLLKECGLMLIVVVCLFQGVWSASSSVSEEIEGRTALTLMSKPIRRRSFIIGKMLGIFWVLLLIVIVLGTILYLSVAYKPLVDARESQLDTPLWQACHAEAFQMLPGLAMVLLQATTLSSVAVALATRVPQLANFAICFTIYLIGNLTPAIVERTADAFPIIQFVAQLIAAIIPTLDYFSMDKAIDTSQGIPIVYLSAIFIYSILYTLVAVFLGLLLFEDRDLA